MDKQLNLMADKEAITKPTLFDGEQLLCKPKTPITYFTKSPQQFVL